MESETDREAVFLSPRRARASLFLEWEGKAGDIFTQRVSLTHTHIHRHFDAHQIIKDTKPAPPPPKMGRGGCGRGEGAGGKTKKKKKEETAP